MQNYYYYFTENIQKLKNIFCKIIFYSLSHGNLSAHQFIYLHSKREYRYINIYIYIVSSFIFHCFYRDFQLDGKTLKSCIFQLQNLHPMKEAQYK